MVGTRSNKPSGDKEVCHNDEFYDSKEDIEDFDITLNLVYQQLTSFKKDFMVTLEQTKIDIIKKMITENDTLKNDIKSLQQNLAAKDEEIAALKHDLSDQKKEGVELKRDLVDLQQYIRRNNIEICGIPESKEESSNDLEKQVIQIAAAVNLNINTKDIEACHRLIKRRNEKGPRKVIVKFVNRKHCETLLKLGKKFKETSVQKKAGLNSTIYVNNNLCSYNKYLWSKAKSLQQKQFIHKFSCFNGVIGVLLTPHDKVHKKIKHINDLIALRPDDCDWKNAITNNL